MRGDQTHKKSLQATSHYGLRDITAPEKQTNAKSSEWIITHELKVHQNPNQMIT